MEARHLRPTRVQQEQDLQTALQKSLQLDLQVDVPLMMPCPSRKEGLKVTNHHCAFDV